MWSLQVLKRLSSVLVTFSKPQFPYFTSNHHQFRAMIPKKRKEKIDFEKKENPFGAHVLISAIHVKTIKKKPRALSTQNVLDFFGGARCRPEIELFQTFHFQRLLWKKMCQKSKIGKIFPKTVADTFYRFFFSSVT